MGFLEHRHQGLPFHFGRLLGKPGDALAPVVEHVLSVGDRHGRHGDLGFAGRSLAVALIDGQLQFCNLRGHGLPRRITACHQVDQSVEPLLDAVALQQDGVPARSCWSLKLALLVHLFFKRCHQIALTMRRLHQQFDHRVFPHSGRDVGGLAPFAFEAVDTPQVVVRDAATSVGHAARQSRTAERAARDAMQWPHAIGERHAVD